MALAELGMPVLVPSDPQDILDLGIHGIEMSRFSGLWVALRIDTSVADGSATTRVAPDRIVPIHPDNTIDGRSFTHQVSSYFLQPKLAELESSLSHQRLELARRYAVANGLNRVQGASDNARVGIIVSGATYLDLRQALNDLGLTDDQLAPKGVRVMKLGMVYPLDRTEIRGFASGLSEIVVVEEKRSFVEAAVKEILYGQPDAPVVSGKLTPQNEPLLRQNADLTPELIATALRSRLSPLVELPELSALPTTSPAPRTPIPLLARTPYFCSGCPHNRSTRTPEGSLVGAGIGCSGMVIMMPSERVGEVLGITQMGGEGATWAGMSPFVSDTHMFQNMGDGTYHHSGSLAVRAAVASGTNITFKILYNSAVAMTGGQRTIGGMSVQSLARELRAEGVARVIVTTEDPRRYRNADLPADVEVRHRDRLIETQEELARIPGVTVLINDQECATELRRKRKRNLVAEPVQRVFINQRVCEGCGDCGEKSNCLSVQPVATEYGRKTQIHQASCNKDYSCLKGDCPSFLTVVPATAGRATRPRVGSPSLDSSELPAPKPVVDSTDFSMRITGIGGTGVVTVAQIIATAAVLSDRFVQSLDQTGLAQKGGAVVSDVKIMQEAITQSNRIGVGKADLYLGCDLLVAASDAYLGVASPDRTVAIVSTAEVPTGSMVTDPAVSFPQSEATVGKVRATTRADLSSYTDARRMTLDLFDDDQYANIFLVGMATQLGALPLDPTKIEAAITLNGVAVDRNLQAFRRGRQLISDPDAVNDAIASRQPQQPEAALHPQAEAIAEAVQCSADSPLGQLVRRRVNDLIAYQNVAYARSYAELIEKVRGVEERAQPGATRLALAAAQYLHKIMAYKDEYEVARLSIDPALKRAMEEEFGAGYRSSFKLHPPILRAMGINRKISLGSWFIPVFMLLYRLRGLRHTPFDVFGWARVRRVERQLVADYRALLEDLSAVVTVDNLDIAIQIAELPDVIRGYEDVKLRSVERYQSQLDDLRSQLAGPTNRLSTVA